MDKTTTIRQNKTKRESSAGLVKQHSVRFYSVFIQKKLKSCRTGWSKSMKKEISVCRTEKVKAKNTHQNYSDRNTSGAALTETDVWDAKNRKTEAQSKTS